MSRRHSGDTVLPHVEDAVILIKRFPRAGFGVTVIFKLVLSPLPQIFFPFFLTSVCLAGSGLV